MTNRRTAGRVLRSVIVLASIAATLTACSPARQPLLAMTLIDGLPVAILHACVKGSAEVSVTENSPAPTTSPASASPSTTAPTPTGTRTLTPTSESYVFSWSVTTEDAPMVSEVPLFTAPTGWTVERNTLDALRKGSRYFADARLTGVFDVSPVNFTLEDLQELDKDEVLYGVNAPLNTVIKRVDFEAKAREACAGGQPSTTPSASTTL